MSVEDQIAHFYKMKSKKDSAYLYDYDENGNYVEYKKSTRKGIRSNEISKTIPVRTYRFATQEEKQSDMDEYNERVNPLVENYNTATKDLYMAWNPKNASDVKSDEELFMLNQTLVESDNTLRNARYAQYFVKIVLANDKQIPINKRIKMNDLYFNNSPADKNVNENIAIVEKQLHSLQRQFRLDDKPMTTISAAKEQRDIFEKNVEKVGEKLKGQSIFTNAASLALSAIDSIAPAPLKPVADSSATTVAPTAAPKSAVPVGASGVSPTKSIINAIGDSIASAITSIIPETKPESASETKPEPVSNSLSDLKKK